MYNILLDKVSKCKLYIVLSSNDLIVIAHSLLLANIYKKKQYLSFLSCDFLNWIYPNRLLSVREYHSSQNRKIIKLHVGKIYNKKLFFCNNKIKIYNKKNGKL